MPKGIGYPSKSGGKKKKPMKKPAKKPRKSGY